MDDKLLIEKQLKTMHKLKEKKLQNDKRVEKKKKYDAWRKILCKKKLKKEMHLCKNDEKV